jgi:hypothetical protein
LNERSGRRHSAPVATVLPLLDLVQRWRVTPTELLAATGLSQSDVEDPLERLELSTIVRLFENARSLTGEPDLGYYLALQKRVSMFGYIGFVAQSARTIGEVLTLALKYAPLVSSAVTFELRTSPRIRRLGNRSTASPWTARPSPCPSSRPTPLPCVSRARCASQGARVRYGARWVRPARASPKGGWVPHPRRGGCASSFVGSDLEEAGFPVADTSPIPDAAKQ